MIATPQPFIIREECEKVAFQKGFRRHLGESQGWSAFASTTARGTINLAAAGIHGPWFLALDHEGVIAELDLPVANMPGPGKGRYAFAVLGELYAALDRVYALSVSLPDAPLREFQSLVAGLPRSTEAERLVVQRIGQDVFRARLVDYWQGRCPLTGIPDTALLRASHIKPWKDCDTDAERLDVHNGFLLSALWDASFDRGLVTFDESGLPAFAEALSELARNQLRWNGPIPLVARHEAYLAWHRENVFVLTV